MAGTRPIAVQQSIRHRMFLVILLSSVLHGCASQRSTAPNIFQFARTVEGRPLLTQNPMLLKNPMKHLPTSIDHLTPNSEVLKATPGLEHSAGVKTHTIIGTGHRLSDLSQGDGVVSLASAHFDGVATECVIEVLVVTAGCTSPTFPRSFPHRLPCETDRSTVCSSS